MIFSVIEHYILRRAMLATLATLGCLVSIVWIIQALRKLDIITSKGAAILIYLQLTTLAVPMLILAIIPIALLIGVIFVINSLNSNSELVVINTSGASSWTLLKPFLTLALLCSLFVGFTGHFAIAWSLVRMKTIATRMQADLASVIVQEGTFNQIEDGITFHIAQRESGGLLRGILIADEREKNKSIIYAARKGTVIKQNDSVAILLVDGQIHQKNHDDTTTTVINYKSYTFDLSTFAGKINNLTLRPKERTTIDLLYPDRNDHFYKTKPGLYRSVIHNRFSEMLWPFAYVTIVLAFAGQSRSSRQSYGAAITVAVGTLILLRGLAFSASNSLRSDPNAIYFVYALPLSGIIVGSFLLIKNRTPVLPKTIQKWIDWLQLSVFKKFEASYDNHFLSHHKKIETKS